MIYRRYKMKQKERLEHVTSSMDHYPGGGQMVDTDL